MRIHSFVVASTALLCIAFTGERLSAATFNFLDVAGDTVVFSDITEANYSLPPGESLFAGVSGSGDTISFQTLNLGIESLSGASLLDGRLVLTATANGGYEIEGVTITQDLSARTFEESFVQLDLSGEVAYDGMTTDLSTAFTKTSNAGDGLSTETPTIELNFSFAPTEYIDIELLDQLFAAVSPGGVGFLAGTDLTISINTIESTVVGAGIPEPGTVFALAFGIGVMVVRRRPRLSA